MPNGSNNSETCKCPACGKQVKLLRNRDDVPYCGTHSDNRGMHCRGVGLIPKKAIIDRKIEAELQRALKAATRPPLRIGYSFQGTSGWNW